MAALGVFMTILFLLSLSGNVFLAAKIAKLNRASTQLSIDPAPERGAITSSRHKLIETMYDVRYSTKEGKWLIAKGWNFHCLCGTIAPATDNPDSEYGEGSEAGAVKAWHNHANLYATLVDAGDDEYAKLKAEFDEYKAQCYCHDVR